MTSNTDQLTPSIDVLYEDDNVLVINKPAGISMHRINESDQSVTIRDIYGSRLADNDPIRGGIIHRLDKDTSGVVVLAKNNPSLEFLQKQFADRTVEKIYLALVWGHLKHPRARIELPLSRSNKSPTAMQVSPNGKMSVSEYHVTAEYGPYSYLSISLHTGRTHQIRVQFAHIGHPVVGDKMYGHKDLPEGLSRQFLHASSIKLILPGTVKKRTFNAPLATDLRAFLETIDG